MDYRKATTEDCALLAELNHQLIRDEGHRNPMTVRELEERMRNWLATEYEAMLFEQDDDVVGYALYREEHEQVYLRQLFVVPHRRRSGIGREAIQILLDRIWPENKRILVEVLSHNEPAIRFWKALGFREYSLALEILPEDRCCS